MASFLPAAPVNPGCPYQCPAPGKGRMARTMPTGNASPSQLPRTGNPVPPAIYSDGLRVLLPAWRPARCCRLKLADGTSRTVACGSDTKALAKHILRKHVPRPFRPSRPPSVPRPSCPSPPTCRNSIIPRLARHSPGPGWAPASALTRSLARSLSASQLSIAPRSPPSSYSRTCW